MLKNKKLIIRVDETTKNAFEEAVVSCGKSSVSSLLLELVGNFLKDKNTVTGSDEKPSREVRSRVVGTRINEKEAEALESILLQENKTAAEFLLCLIRSRINKAPHLGQSEMLQLRESNKQLLAIGRNVNQVVKAIHGTENKNELTISDHLLKDVKTHVDDLAKSISRLIEKNKQRDIHP